MIIIYNKILIIFTVSLFFLTIGQAQDFSGLETISPEPEIRLHFVKSATHIINRTIKHPVMFVIELIEIRIDKTKNEFYLIEYNSGASNDPIFIIYKSGKKKIAEIPGKELFIPGDGSVYVSGHTNSMFNVRRKFILKTEKLIEVKQPFLYVGLDSETLADITIYADKKLTTPIENIKKGSKITVLIADQDYFLIRTAFGLIGWILPKLSQSDEIRPDMGGTGIKGLFFNGD